MSRFNDLQERVRKFQEEQQTQDAEQTEHEDKDATIAELESQLKDEKIKALQDEIADLKSSAPTQEKTVQNTKKEPKQYSIGKLIVVCVFIYFIYSLFNSSSDSTPKYVKSATSDLKAGLTAQLGVLINCSNIQSNNSWFVGCKFKSGGNTVYLFEVKENSDGNPNYLPYKAYAVNGKAMQIMNKPKMDVYRITKSTSMHPVGDLVSHFQNS